MHTFKSHIGTVVRDTFYDFSGLVKISYSGYIRVTLNGGIHGIHHNNFHIIATGRNGTIYNSGTEGGAGHLGDMLLIHISVFFQIDSPRISRNASDFVVLFPYEADGFFHTAGEGGHLSENLVRIFSGKRKKIIHVFVQIFLRGLASQINNGIA